MKRLSLILGVCPLVSLCVPVLSAQATAKATPSLSGFVLDPSGAAIPHATLHLHSAAVDSETNSDAAGRFSLSAAPGTYQLIVSAPGFSTQVRNGFVLAPGRSASLNLTLKIASEAEQVEVDSDSALSTEGSANKSALTFSGQQLDTFSDDPTVMQQELQAIGGSDPSNPSADLRRWLLQWHHAAQGEHPRDPHQPEPALRAVRPVRRRPASRSSPSPAPPRCMATPPSASTTAPSTPPAPSPLCNPRITAATSTPTSTAPQASTAPSTSASFATTQRRTLS